MPDALWEFTAGLIRVRWSVDVPRVTRTPVEQFQAVGGHRAGRARVLAPIGLVPDAVARLAAFEKLRAIPVRAAGYFGGAR